MKALYKTLNLIQELTGESEERVDQLYILVRNVASLEDIRNKVILDKIVGSITQGEKLDYWFNYLEERLKSLGITGNTTPPYSLTDYEAAQEQGLDLDDWNDYQKFYRLGEQEEHE